MEKLPTADDYRRAFLEMQRTGEPQTVHYGQTRVTLCPPRRLTDEEVELDWEPPEYPDTPAQDVGWLD